MGSCMNPECTETRDALREQIAQERVDHNRIEAEQFDARVIAVEALRKQLAARDREIEKLRAVEKAARLLREKVVALFKSYERSGIPSEDFGECIDNLMDPCGLDAALHAACEKGKT